MSNDNDDITQAWDELLAGLDWIADAESADEMRTRAAALHTMARDLRRACEERPAERCVYDDGGPAFPAEDIDHGYVVTGMSLRDYFAGQALAGLWAQSSEGVLLAILRSAEGAGERRQAETIARLAYETADFMLAAAKGGRRHG